MNLQQRDQKHLWHPLTQHKLHPNTIPVLRAKGAVLYGEDNREWIDGIASWYTSMYGHCNDYILNEVTKQMHTLDQVVFSGFTHEPAIKLSEALIDILPLNQEKIFFSDNGSTATEIGIKMALQYHFNKGNKRNTIIAFEEGFHGDTFGAMSVSGLSVYNGPFAEFFISVARIPVPNGTNNAEVIALFQKLVSKGTVAGFIYEPLVQGAAAMKMHDAKGLCELLRICKENEIISIADEVMTGFGKTGTNFASDQLLNKPDIICLSKALTAGLVPMAATSCSQKIYDAFYSNDMAKGFFHGHTYTANPLACTAALAGIELLNSPEIIKQRKIIEDAHKEFDKQIRNHPKVAATRQCGIIYAIDLNVKMDRYGDLRDQLFKFFMDNGVFLRPLGNTIYILPPFVISKNQLQKIYDTIESAIEMVIK
ncbi:adenosylmethionine--8-amino-7-oxononanoate transaminase [Ascidiimonas sp. W6]|uniref:adenosylmethionine--8-amino-7-oxononanoate transaminase n=1 Tax=Ascidiimonas meishanensis TaxID=3128903 RepID=UPI0030ED6F68